jgi:predicted DCC family thiol-disulfide oxidoreductase YuxK
MQSTTPQILFYDGECGLCSRSVRFLMHRDRQRRLYFAPLQGTTARTLIPMGFRQLPSTVIYRRADGVLSYRSDAICWALIDIESRWSWFARMLLLLPRGFRDSVYNWIARNRHRFFSQGACSLDVQPERVLP